MGVGRCGEHRVDELGAAVDADMASKLVHADALRGAVTSTAKGGVTWRKPNLKSIHISKLIQVAAV